MQLSGKALIHATEQNKAIISVPANAVSASGTSIHLCQCMNQTCTGLIGIWNCPTFRVSKLHISDVMHPAVLWEPVVANISGFAVSSGVCKFNYFSEANVKESRKCAALCSATPGCTEFSVSEADGCRFAMNNYGCCSQVCGNQCHLCGDHGSKSVRIFHKLTGHSSPLKFNLKLRVRSGE